MTSDTGDTQQGDGWKSVSFKVRTEDKEKLKERTDNLSARLRSIIQAYNEVEDEYGYDEELERMDEVILNTYLNAVRKNISLLKSKEEKIEEELEKIGDDKEEVLVEVSIDIEGMTRQ